MAEDKFKMTSEQIAESIESAALVLSLEGIDIKQSEPDPDDLGSGDGNQEER